MDKTETCYWARLWTSNQDYQDLNKIECYDFDLDLLHRTNGPAVEFVDGIKEWWQNGQLHRLDGPAVERPDGHKEWWINDQELDPYEIEAWFEENNIDLSTPEGQTAFVLKWS